MHGVLLGSSTFLSLYITWVVTLLFWKGFALLLLWQNKKEKMCNEHMLSSFMDWWNCEAKMGCIVHLIQLLYFTTEKTMLRNWTDFLNIAPLFMKFKGSYWWTNNSLVLIHGSYTLLLSGCIFNFNLIYVSDKEIAQLFQMLLTTFS